MNSYRADHNNYKDIDKIDFRKYKSWNWSIFNHFRPFPGQCRNAAN